MKFSTDSMALDCVIGPNLMWSSCRGTSTPVGALPNNGSTFPFTSYQASRSRLTSRASPLSCKASAGDCCAIGKSVICVHKATSFM
eukprot:593719-Amphidinium_carterae.1